MDGGDPVFEPGSLPPRCWRSWLDGEPEVPEGLWYKRFSCMTVCGMVNRQDFPVVG